jgi:hypothetical protein
VIETMLNHQAPTRVRIMDDHEVCEGSRRAWEDEAGSFILWIVAKCRTVIDLASNQAGSAGKAPALLASVRPVIGLQLIDDRIEKKFIGSGEDAFRSIWEKECGRNGFRLIAPPVCGIYEVRVTLHRHHHRESGSGRP